MLAIILPCNLMPSVYSGGAGVTGEDGRGCDDTSGLSVHAGH